MISFWPGSVALRARLRSSGRSKRAGGGEVKGPWPRNRTLRSPARIERIATRQLHLIAPARDEAIVLERVTPSAPPEKSIVAAR